MSQRLTLIAPALLCAIGMNGSPGHAQSASIQITRNTHISVGDDRSAFAESHLAINPRDSRNLIATSILIERGDTRSAVYFSVDGGKSWQRSRPAVAGDSVFDGGDPVVYFDGEGGAWFSTLAGGFRVSRSSDGGRTWQPSVVLPGGGFDRQWLAFDHTGLSYNGRVYGVGYQTITNRLDGHYDRSIGVIRGNVKDSSWRTANILNSPDTVDMFFVPGDPMVTPTGRLVIPFNSWMTGGSDSMRVGHIWAVASDNGASQFKPARIVGSIRQRAGRGYDGYKLLGPVRGAVDTSHSTYRGWMYLTWVDLDGDHHTVRVAHSADGGETWSAAISVRDSGAKGDPATPMVAVNGDGVLGVVWYDRRDDPKNDCYDLYTSASLDGGETFLPNVRATNGHTCPTAPGNWSPAAFGYLQPPMNRAKDKAQAAIALMIVPSRWPNGGDTQGLVADDHGAFHAGWVNGAGGVMQLWETQFAVNGKRAAPVVAAEVDHTEEVRFLLSNPVIDFAAGVMSVDAEIENTSATAVAGPLSAKLTELSESIPGLRASNADNALPGLGAIWRFEIPGGAVLKPHEKTKSRTLKFSIPHEPPAKPTDPLRALFRISSPAKS